MGGASVAVPEVRIALMSTFTIWVYGTKDDDPDTFCGGYESQGNESSAIAWAVQQAKAEGCLTIKQVTVITQENT